MIPGFTITETQTQPTRPGKAPRPVWNVTCPPGYEDAMYALGGRQWRGQFSFWSDPTEDIENLTQADRTSVADRETGKRERAAARSERLAARAAKHSARSRELVNRAVDMTKCIPMGQPILVGHHSEGRHRNLLKRSDNAMRRGVEAGAYADHLERRSEAAARTAEAPTLGYMMNRLKEAQAGLKKVQGWQPSSIAREPERHAALVTEYSEQVAHWEQQIAEAGGVPFDRTTVHKGMLVCYGGSWYPVIRVNRDTVTVSFWLGIRSFTWLVPYHLITELHQPSARQQEALARLQGIPASQWGRVPEYLGEIA